LLFVAATPAHADSDDATRRAARSLGNSGVEAYEAGDYAKAAEKLDKAFRALQAPSLGLWSARAFVKVNRLVEAAERYQAVIRLPTSGGDEAVQRQAKADAETELAQLNPQIPNLVVKLEGAAPEQVSIKIGQESLASALVDENRPVNPGHYTVEATRGADVVHVEVDVKPGETKPVVLRFQAAPHASETAVSNTPSAAPAGAPGHEEPSRDRPSSARRTVGFVTLGIGGAGLIFGGVSALIANNKKQTLLDSGECMGTQCLPSQSGTASSYNTWGTLASVGIIGGALVAATGVVLIVTAPSEPKAVAVNIGVGSVSISRSF
jgi:hypothetical protein